MSRILTEAFQADCFQIPIHTRLQQPWRNRRGGLDHRQCLRDRIGLKRSSPRQAFVKNDTEAVDVGRRALCRLLPADLFRREISRCSDHDIRLAELTGFADDFGKAEIGDLWDRDRDR